MNIYKMVTEDADVLIIAANTKQEAINIVKETTYITGLDEHIDDNTNMIGNYIGIENKPFVLA